MTLRKLTEKSKIDFGVHRGNIVEQILRKSNGSQYMRWLYYNSSHIDLCDDLIKQLDIHEQIPKPGKNPELYQSTYRIMRILFKDKSAIIKPDNRYHRGYTKLSLQAHNTGNKTRYTH